MLFENVGKILILSILKKPEFHKCLDGLLFPLLGKKTWTKLHLKMFHLRRTCTTWWEATRTVATCGRTTTKTFWRAAKRRWVEWGWATVLVLGHISQPTLIGCFPQNGEIFTVLKEQQIFFVDNIFEKLREMLFYVLVEIVNFEVY